MADFSCIKYLVSLLKVVTATLRFTFEFDVSFFVITGLFERCLKNIFHG